MPARLDDGSKAAEKTTTKPCRIWQVSDVNKLPQRLCKFPARSLLLISGAPASICRLSEPDGTTTHTHNVQSIIKEIPQLKVLLALGTFSGQPTTIILTELDT